MKRDFNEYDGSYHFYLTPSVVTPPSALYDTKEKAVQSAMEILKLRDRDQVLLPLPQEKPLTIVVKGFFLYLFTCC